MGEIWFTFFFIGCLPHIITSDVIMGTMASQITSLTIVYPTVYSGTDQKTSKLHITGFCEGNSPVTGEFPAQMASNAENVSICWRHHVGLVYILPLELLHCKQCYVIFNSSWPSDTIWWHRSGSTLPQVKAYCLTAPSHYLNPCWDLSSKVFCGIHLIIISQEVLMNMCYRDYTPKIIVRSPGSQRVNWTML